MRKYFIFCLLILLSHYCFSQPGAKSILPDSTTLHDSAALIKFYQNYITKNSKDTSATRLIYIAYDSLTSISEKYKSYEIAEKSFIGAYEFSLKKKDSVQVYNRYIDLVAFYNRQIYYNYPAEYHTVATQPRFMLFNIFSAKDTLKDSAIIRITAGSVEGLLSGLPLEVISSTKANLPARRGNMMIAKGRITEVHTNYSIAIVKKFYPADSLANILQGDMILCRVKTAFISDPGYYTELLENNIVFTDNYDWRPYGLRQASAYVIDEQEKMIDNIYLNNLRKLVEKYQTDTISSKWFRKKISYGFFKGKDLLEAYKLTTIAHIRFFLDYVKKNPDKYMSRRYPFYDVYGGWLLNGSEFSEGGILKQLSINVGTPLFNDILSIYGKGIMRKNGFESWKNIIVDSLDENIIPAQYIKVFDTVAHFYSNSEMLAWNNYIRAKVYALKDDLKTAASLLTTAASQFEAIHLPDEQQLCKNLITQLGVSRMPVVAVQSAHFLPYQIAMSNKGRYFITYGQDAFIKVWDANYMRQLESISAHKGGTEFVTFTYNDRYFITCGTDGYMKIWETRSLLLVKEINTRKEIKYVQMDVHGEKIFTTSTDSILTVYNFRTGTIDTTYRLNQTAISACVILPRSPNYVYSSSDDSLFHLTDLLTGENLTTVKIHDKVVGINVTEDRQYTSVLTNGNLIKVFEANGSLLRKYYPKPYRLTFGDKTIIPQFDVDDENKMIAFIQDTFQLSLSFLDSGVVYTYNIGNTESITDIKFLPGGKKLLMATFMGKLYLINVAGVKDTKNIHSTTIGSSSQVVSAISFSSNDQKIAFQAGNTIVQELNTGKSIFLGKESGTLIANNVYFLYGDSVLQFVPYNGASILKLNLTTADTVYNSGMLNYIFDYQEMSSDGKRMLILNDSLVNIYDFITGSLINQLVIDSRAYHQVRRVLFLNGTDHIAVINDSARSVGFYDLKSKTPELITRFRMQSGRSFGGACYLDSGHTLMVTGNDNSIYIFDGETCKLKKRIDLNVYDSTQTAYLIASDKTGKKIFVAMDYTFLMYDLANDKLLRNFKQQNNSLSAAAFSHSGDKLAVGDFAGQIHIYDTHSLEKIVDIFSYIDRAPVIVTPENYYMAEQAALKELYYKYDQLLYPFEEFDLLYNRPDKVLEKLAVSDSFTIKSYRLAWQKRIRRSGNKFEQVQAHLNPPKIKILNREEVPDFAVNSDKIHLALQCKANNDSVIAYNIWINGIPIYGQSWKRTKVRTSETVVHDSVILSPGLNLLQVACRNSKGVSSFREKVEINNMIPPATRSKTYLFCMSVSDYKSRQFKLKYAVKDGRDLVKAFSDKLGADLVVDTLFDQNSTLSNVTRWRKKMENTNVNDRVIVYVSGHGLLGGNNNFYYATYDVDFKSPAAKGLLYDQLEAMLDQIPARDKLLLLDACHSGELDQDPQRLNRRTAGADSNVTILASKGIGSEKKTAMSSNSAFELMQEQFADVSEGNGTIVISASAGNSFAYESDTWKNGIFTWSILRGLENLGADGNNDGSISINELRTYVNRSVTYYTKGLQKPNLRQANIDRNWILW